MGSERLLRALVGCSLMGVAGCKLDEATFRKRYDDTYCKVLEQDCGGTCRVQDDEEAWPTCDFDQAKAKECLDGEWTCIPIGTADDAPELPQGPAACAEVLTNCTL